MLVNGKSLKEAQDLGAGEWLNNEKKWLRLQCPVSCHFLLPPVCTPCQQLAIFLIFHVH